MRGLATGTDRQRGKDRRRRQKSQAGPDPGTGHRPGRRPAGMRTTETWPTRAVRGSIQLPPRGVGADHDSIGLFQQRPSMGPLGAPRHNSWHPPTTALPSTPRSAAGDRLARTLCLPSPPRPVQRSAFPDAYAGWAHLARDWSGTRRLTTRPAAPTYLASELNTTRHVVPAAQSELGHPLRVGRRRRPTVPPKDSPAATHAAIGGCSAVGFECSGLALYAWATRRASNYAHLRRHPVRAKGGAYPVAHAQPADLLFWATNRGTGSIPHVAIYMGDDKMIEAPQSGESVHRSHQSVAITNSCPSPSNRW